MSKLKKNLLLLKMRSVRNLCYESTRKVFIRVSGRCPFIMACRRMTRGMTWVKMLMAFHEGLLESCKKSGAEAMKVCEQDPPKSGVDLEGA